MTTIAVDLADLADLAFTEAQRHPPRSPGRRAASHLWVSLTMPPAKSVDAARRAVASFGSARVQAGAIELLHQLAGSQLVPEGPAVRVGQPGQEQTE